MLSTTRVATHYFCIKNSMQNNNGAASTHKKRLYRRLTNVSLLIFGLTMTFSGLYIQIHYHIQDSAPLRFSQWTFIHKWSALLFTSIVAAHVALHLKWYNAVLEKQLFRKNRVTLILTTFMFAASLSGFVPWTLSLFPFHSEFRHTLVEIHDKIGVIFMVVMIGHIIKRCKWYIKMQ